MYTVAFDVITSIEALLIITFFFGMHETMNNRVLKFPCMIVMI